MECHKCEHQVALTAGKFRGLAFEQTPCARCDGMGRESYPLQFLDLAPSDETPVAGLSVPELAFPEEEPAPVLPVAVLVSAMAAFLALPDLELRILRLRHQGCTHAHIAQELRLTKRAVEMRFARALVRWPELAVLFPARAARRSSAMADSGV